MILVTSDDFYYPQVVEENVNFPWCSPIYPPGTRNILSDKSNSADHLITRLYLSGAGRESHFKLGPVASARDILYVAPDGTIDNAGNHLWDATPSCCNFYGSTVDDKAYLESFVHSVSKSYNVDSKRIYIVGHSNGGFMAHHMTCTHSDQIAAIVSFSGATFKEQSSCQPAQPISIL